MNAENSIKHIAKNVPELGRSMEYVRSEWHLDRDTLRYAVRENCPDGGSYHSRRVYQFGTDKVLDRCIRKVIKVFA